MMAIFLLLLFWMQYAMLKYYQNCPPVSSLWHWYWGINHFGSPIWHLSLKGKLEHWYLNKAVLWANCLYKQTDWSFSNTDCLYQANYGSLGWNGTSAVQENSNGLVPNVFQAILDRWKPGFLSAHQHFVKVIVVLSCNLISRVISFWGL